MEKEANAKGVPIGHALEINIPPPRPKKKPGNPYPRKKGVGPPASQVGARDGKLLTSTSFPHCKNVLELVKEPRPEVTIIFFFLPHSLSCSFHYHFFILHSTET